LWRGWKNQMTTQNRQKSNAKKGSKQGDIMFKENNLDRDFISKTVLLFVE